MFSNKKSVFFSLILILCVISLGFVLGRFYTLYEGDEVVSPFISLEEQKALPLEQYSIPNLIERKYEASPALVLEEIISKQAVYTSYLFSYTTMDKRITGLINIPNDSDASNPNKSYPVVIMLRGWAPKASYTTGVGTKNAAGVFAQNGYVTISPDFFDYGDSDPQPEDSWEARFIKPINVIELIKTVSNSPTISLELQEKDGLSKRPSEDADAIKLNPDRIGMWAHSNGGQIALTTLEILSQNSLLDSPIPTTLWAPVTAPFPYSILFFSDEVEDEGKASRKWLSLLEDDYDVFDFTMTQHLDKLTGPIQLQHGTADEAALIAWSDEFTDKIAVENKRRKDLDPEATEAAELHVFLDDPIEIEYITYPGADHNMRPNWEDAVGKDLEFFKENL